MGVSMTQRSRFTRRKVLASIGAVGLVTSGASLVGAMRGEPPYTHYTYAQTADGNPNLQIAWYETYKENGSFELQERSSDDLDATNESFEDAATAGEFVDDESADYVDTGPVVSFSDVMPGDEGKVIVGLLTTDQPADVWFLPEAPVDSYLENDHIEPEIAANDTTPGEGELQTALEIDVWYDDGVLGFGGCNGVRDPGESLVGDDRGTVSGTLADVYERFALDSDTTGIRLFQCLETGENRCVTVHWRLPEDTGNHVQTDSVEFNLRFAATPCLDEPTSPFEGGEVA
jgi:hypothetical protein